MDEHAHPIPALRALTPDDRIDDLLSIMRSTDRRVRGLAEMSARTFRHVMGIEASLRAHGIVPSRRWRDAALVLGGAVFTSLVVLAFFAMKG